MEYPMVYVLVLVLLNFTTDVHAEVLVASMNPLAVGSNVTLELSSPTNINAGTWTHLGAIIILMFPGGQYISPTWVDRITFNRSSSELSIHSVTLLDSGLYILQGLDPSLHAVMTLSVQEPISNVSLKADSTNLIELNNTAIFTCSVSSGTSLSYLWLNGSSEVTANEGVQLSNGNSTLTIARVTRYDEGPFKCEVINGISNGTSEPVHLNIRYGPSNLTIMVVPEMAAYKTGTHITLSCFAESKPPASFMWSFGGMSLNQHGPVLHLENTKENQTGSYTCLAYNNVTLRFASVTTMIRIVEPISAVGINLVGKLPILNESVTLSCEVTGPVDYIHWNNNWMPLYPNNRTTFSMDNRTMTLNPVQLSDNGDYHCQAFNAVNNLTSLAYRLVVNYGPEKPVIMGKAIAMTGYNVTFNCSASSQPASHFSWFFNGNLVANGSVYETGPLTLASNGEYTCMAFNNVTGRNSTATKMLTVVVPVTMAKVKVMGAQPIADQTFTLTCETSGTIYSIHWKRNGLPLSADNRTVFSMDNTTLTFSPVLTSDNGDIQCAAYNPLSNSISTDYILTVNYGPEKPSINGPELVKTGTNVTFNCSASSQPPSHFSWFFNGALVANGSVYETGPLTLASNGEYTCMALNNVTDRNSTATKMLTVVAPITEVYIQIPLKSAIDGQSFTLSCDVTGPADSIYWMRTEMPLYPDNRTFFSIDNRTMTLNPVQHSDQGDYHCEAGNAVSLKKSQAYRLWVNYGPGKPMIDGPSMAKTGYSVTFNCSASSQPASHFSWFFNGTLVANGSVYETGPLTLASNGEYTCMAFNNITGRNSTATKMLTVIAPITSVSISTGGKLAIVNDSLTMICNVVGEPDSIYWYRYWMHLYPNNRTVFSTDNRTMTLNPVQRYDSGDYHCEASNYVNNMTSPAFTLVVNYGPDYPMIFGPAVAETGKNVTFNCSASSQPPSHFRWFFNGTLVANGSVYETGPLTLASNGEYTCMASNNITDRNSTATKMLTVIEAITSVMVKPNTTPIAAHNLTLICDVTGPYDTIYWMMHSAFTDLNGTMHSSTTIFASNTSLDFSPVKVSDDGRYQCVASNIFGRHYSPEYQLQVNYGPLSVAITGPGTVVIGSVITATLRCSADSQPTSEYQWVFNNQTVLGTGPILAVIVSSENAGDYTCIARNPVTNITLSKTERLNVTDRSLAPPLQSRGGLTFMALFALSLPVVNNWLLY